MSDVSSVINFFSTANEGFITTTSGSILSGAATVPLNSTSGLTNGTIFVGIIEPGLTKEQTFTGTVDTGGAQITGVKWTRGSNADHSAGVSVVDYVTGTGHNMMTKGMLVSHNQDGTIKNNAITSAAQITDGIIGDAEMATAVKPVTIQNESEFDYIVGNGCVWTADAAGSTKAASMTSGVVYIAGKRLTVAAVTSRTFTASKDVYVDFSDNSDGTALITYTDNTTNAASPALTGVRNAIVVVGASNIATAASINQGQEDRILPIASSIAYSVTDSIGNLICPRDPTRKLLGYRQITSNASAGTSISAITGLTCPVIVPTARKVTVSAFSSKIVNGATTANLFSVWDGVVGSGTKVTEVDVETINNAFFGLPIRTYTPSSTTKTYNAGLVTSSGSVSLNASSTVPAFIKVELA